MTADIVDQLKAALDRAEATARAATPGPWHALDGGVADSEHEQWPVADTDSKHNREDRVFIAANGPDVALRTVAAHRRIVNLYEAATAAQNATRGSTTDAFARGLTNAYRTAVEAIASTYLPERVAEEAVPKLSVEDSTHEA